MTGLHGTRRKARILQTIMIKRNQAARTKNVFYKKQKMTKQLLGRCNKIYTTIYEMLASSEESNARKDGSFSRGACSLVSKMECENSVSEMTV